MVGDIRAHLEIKPFRPFRIRTADGHEYSVPTADHIFLPPGPPRVYVFDDEGIVAMLPPLLISGLLVADNMSQATPTA